MKLLNRATQEQPAQAYKFSRFVISNSNIASTHPILRVSIHSCEVAEGKGESRRRESRPRFSSLRLARSFFPFFPPLFFFLVPFLSSKKISPSHHATSRFLSPTKPSEESERSGLKRLSLSLSLFNYLRCLGKGNTPPPPPRLPLPSPSPLIKIYLAGG